MSFTRLMDKCLNNNLLHLTKMVKPLVFFMKSRFPKFFNLILIIANPIRVPSAVYR